MIEIDNKKMWESILRFRFETKVEDIRNNPVGTVVKFIGDSIKHALNEQGLEYKNGDIVSIEPKQTNWTKNYDWNNDTMTIYNLSKEEHLKILYGIYRLWYETDGFDGMKKEIEEIPQYIKDIVDGIIASSRKAKEE